MEELVTKDSTQSSACWQAMEEMARRHGQQWLQGLLEDEVTQFLGRARYGRRDEGERGYRNGYGKPRQMTTRLPGLVALLLALLLTLGSACRLAAPAADGPEPHQPLVEPEPPDVTAAPDDPPAGRGGADLLIAEIMVSDRNPAAGGPFVLSVIVGNDGTAAAPATGVRFVRSADEEITTDDSEVGTVELPPIAVAGRAGGSVRLSAPARGGTYYYGACVEAVSGESETGNNCSAAVAASDRTEAGTVAIPQVVAFREFGVFKRLNAQGTGGTYYYRACVDAVATESDTTNNCGDAVELRVHADAPDFVVGAETSDGTVSAGGTFTVEVLVINFGSIPSDTTTLRLYRSVDDTISSADSELDTVAMSQLATGFWPLAGTRFR